MGQDFISLWSILQSTFANKKLLIRPNKLFTSVSLKIKWNLQIASLHFGQHAKCCSVACKCYKFVEADNATCCITPMSLAVNASGCCTCPTSIFNEITKIASRL